MKKLMTMLISITVLSMATAFAQYTVRGTVVDANGPVVGVTVLEQGTTNGTETGLDGEYTITVPSATTVLQFSFIGYKSVFLPANQASKVVLEEDSELLKEVVIIGYGTVRKSDMTGSVVAIKAEEVNRGSVTSPSAMLVGKVPGLRITPADGQPGASATIRIRGAASLNANNDPLIVIDGVPITKDGGAGMGDPLASVNPNDIESYSILKDASATAIYGSRASNGVIIITTKKGTGKGLHVNYSSSYSLKQNANTLKMMTGSEFDAYIRENRPESVQYLGWNGETYNTDWQKQIYRLAFNTDQNISLYGGGGVFPFRVSLGYNYDQATLKVGDNQRGNIDISLSPKFFKDHLSINLNAKAIYQHTNWASSAVGNAVTFDPTKPIYFTDANGNIDKSKVSNGYWNWLGADGAANTMATVNPLSTMYDYTNVANSYRGIGNLQIDYKVHGLEDLRANLNLGMDISSNKGEKYNQLGTISAMRETLDKYYKYSNYNRNMLLEAYLDYNHAFKHSVLDVMGGYSWQHNYVKYDETEYYNVEPRGQEADIYQIKPTDAKEYYLVSFFGRINYNILSRYLFTFTARGDASSRFSKANRWGFFPSAAFAWNIKEENWVKSSKAVSQMKIRFGWGRTGQQDIGDDYYPYLARYYSASSLTMKYLMGTDGYQNTLSPLAYNPNLKWETTETFNVALDFGFANDRITGTIDAYLRNTYDLLNVIPISLGSNFGNTLISNVGNMQNKGIEVALNFVPVQTRDWRWTIGGNITFQDVKITKLTNQDDTYLGVPVGAKMGGTDGYTSLHRKGFAPYTYYLYQQLYDANGDPVENGLVDRNGDGKITTDDRYVTGASATPWSYYGFNTTLTYKNWDFGINGHGSIGNEILNRSAMNYATSYNDDYTKAYLSNLSPKFLQKGWHAPIDDNQKYSDMFLEDGSFFRIDDINLGYTFRLKNDLSIRLAGSVQNVCVFTKYTGLDPEITAIDGVDGTIIPRPRLYTLRLSINF